MRKVVGWATSGQVFWKGRVVQQGGGRKKKVPPPHGAGRWAHGCAALGTAAATSLHLVPFARARHVCVLIDSSAWCRGVLFSPWWLLPLQLPPPLLPQPLLPKSPGRRSLTLIPMDRARIFSLSTVAFPR